MTVCYPCRRKSLWDPQRTICPMCSALSMLFAGHISFSQTSLATGLAAADPADRAAQQLGHLDSAVASHARRTLHTAVWCRLAGFMTMILEILFLWLMNEIGCMIDVIDMLRASSRRNMLVIVVRRTSSWFQGIFTVTREFLHTY